MQNKFVDKQLIKGGQHLQSWDKITLDKLHLFVTLKHICSTLLLDIFRLDL